MYNLISQHQEHINRTLWRKERAEGEDSRFMAYQNFGYCNRKHGMPAFVEHENFMTTYRWNHIGTGKGGAIITTGKYLPDYTVKFIKLSYRGKNNKRGELDSNGIITMERFIRIGRTEEEDEIIEPDW